MKAIILAGGQAIRLRPLTVNTPKAIVPIFNRPFLYYQFDLLKQVKEIDEVILSLNYQPDKIETVVEQTTTEGLKVRYLVEPKPLGTGGAVKYAESYLDDSVIVLNGDVLTQIDLNAVLEIHRERRASATIVLTPVANPSAYGLVETDSDGNVRKFIEKPDPNLITCNTINAGVYILEPSTFDRIPKDTMWSIERSYFPSLVNRRETFIAYISDDYWIDIGTPAKYKKVHRDIMDGKYRVLPQLKTQGSLAWLAPNVRVESGVKLEGPYFIDRDCVIRKQAHLRPYAVIGHGCTIGEDAQVGDSVIWPNTTIGQNSRVSNSLLGRKCRIGHSVTIGPDLVLGDESVVTDYSRIERPAPMT